MQITNLNYRKFSPPPLSLPYLVIQYRCGEKRYNENGPLRKYKRTTLSLPWFCPPFVDILQRWGKLSKVQSRSKWPVSHHLRGTAYQMLYKKVVTWSHAVHDHSSSHPQIHILQTNRFSQEIKIPRVTITTFCTMGANITSPRPPMQYPVHGWDNLLPPNS